MLFVYLLLLIPLSLVMRYVVDAPPLWIFAFSIIAIIPLAEWVRRATEHLAHVAGSTIGGLVNITFGNAAELILALFILADGHVDVVRAQITGSIIGNSLLGLGLGVVAGSWGRARQTFDRARAGLLASLLVLSVIGLLIPSLFDIAERAITTSAEAERADHRLSIAVSVVLIAVYIGNLIYTLVTHRDVFATEDHVTGADADGAAAAAWPLWRSLAVLVGATAFVAWEAELVSGALEATAEQLGLTTFFLGIIVLAVVGNAAEYISAVYFARQDRMGLVMSITVGSTIQVALVAAPVLVLASHLMGHPMSLVFHNPLELMGIAAVAFIVNAIAHDGETTWFEGVLLLAVYALLGLAFFFISA